MRDPEKTVGRMADQAKTVFLSYIDSQGFPATRAMLPPREREGIRVFWFSTNTSSQKVSAFREIPRGASISWTGAFSGVQPLRHRGGAGGPGKQRTPLAARRHHVLLAGCHRPGLLRAEIHGRKGAGITATSKARIFQFQIDRNFPRILFDSNRRLFPKGGLRHGPYGTRAPLGAVLPHRRAPGLYALSVGGGRNR